MVLEELDGKHYRCDGVERDALRRLQLARHRRRHCHHVQHGYEHHRARSEGHRSTSRRPDHRLPVSVHHHAGLLLRLRSPARPRRQPRHRDGRRRVLPWRQHIEHRQLLDASGRQFEVTVD